MSTDPQSPVVLSTVANDAEAAAIIAALEEQGIKAEATGGFTAGFAALAPGDVQVVVRQADAERARQILAETAGQQANVDWSQVDVGEPEPSEGETADAPDDE